jgi:hypothetical protein
MSLPSRKFYFHMLLKKISNNENASDNYCFNKNLEILSTPIINEAMTIVFFMFCALRFSLISNKFCDLSLLPWGGGQCGKKYLLHCAPSLSPQS